MIEARKLEQEDVADELVRNSEVKLLIESIRNRTTEGK